jgi:hypothetical protein
MWLQLLLHCCSFCSISSPVRIGWAGQTNSERRSLMATIDNEKIQKVLQKVKLRRERHLQKQAEKTIENVSPEVIEAVKKMDRANADQGGGKDFMVMAKEYQAAHKCRLIDAIGAVSRMHPEAHDEYIRKANA